MDQSITLFRQQLLAVFVEGTLANLGRLNNGIGAPNDSIELHRSVTQSDKNLDQGSLPRFSLADRTARSSPANLVIHLTLTPD